MSKALFPPFRLREKHSGHRALLGFPSLGDESKNAPQREQEVEGVQKVTRSMHRGQI